MTARRFTGANEVVYEASYEGIRLAAAGDGFTTTGGAPTQRGAGANMSVDVAAANWRIGGTAYSTAGVTNVVVTAAHATLPRQDLVYANAAGIQYLVGTAAAAPSATVLYPDPPDLPANSVPIALIEVAAGVTSILDARIIDCRSMLSGYGGLGSPSASAVGDASADGTATTLSRSDHKHAREAFATPAIVLGTAAAAGVATTPIRSDATIVAFDATVPAAVGTAAVGSQAVAARRDHVHPTGAGVPTTQAFGDAAATGTGPAAAMTDHKHGMPAAPAAAAMTLIADTVLAAPAANITFSSIPGTYHHLVIVGQLLSATAAGEAVMGQFNADAGANYSDEQLKGSTATASAAAEAAGQTRMFLGVCGNVRGGGFFKLEIPNYARTTLPKVCLATSSEVPAQVATMAAEWNSTAAITSVKIYLNSGNNLAIGSNLSLYGIL